MMPEHMPVITDAFLSPTSAKTGQPVLVSVSVAEGALADCITDARYVLIVDQGRLALLRVQDDVDAVNLCLADRATGDLHDFFVDNGRLGISHASDSFGSMELRVQDRSTGIAYGISVRDRKIMIS